MATVAPTPPVLPSAMSNSCAVARKRRKEIMMTHRDGAGATVSPSFCDQEKDTLPPKKRKISQDLSSDFAVSNPQTTKNSRTPVQAVAPNGLCIAPKTRPKTKKPQMRYDPEVPMSKEAAAAWRKEQRRKRNRESAAASRQKQRDRIAELEVEVSEWKSKFEEAMKRLQFLEERNALGMRASSPEVVTSTTEGSSAVVSPCTSPGLSPQPSPTGEVNEGPDSEIPQEKSEDRKVHVNEISRQAVKIAGELSSSFSSSVESLSDPEFPLPVCPMSLPDLCYSSGRDDAAHGGLPLPSSVARGQEIDNGDLEEFLRDAFST